MDAVAGCVIAEVAGAIPQAIPAAPQPRDEGGARAEPS
jgi:hypothetical protein